MNAVDIGRYLSELRRYYKITQDGWQLESVLPDSRFRSGKPMHPIDKDITQQPTLIYLF